MSPFDFQSRRSAQFFQMEEAEFADQLREAGWGESAIEMELANLRDYKRRFKLDEPPELDIEAAAEGNEYMAAVLRKRNRKRENGD